MIKVECSLCGKELNEPGAIYLNTPDELGSVDKSHICVRCNGLVWRVFRMLIDSQSPQD